MNLFKRLVGIVLTVQLVVGPWAVSWGQAVPEGERPRAKAPQASSGSIKAPKPAAPETRGVEAVTPALEKLPGGRALSRAVVPEEYVLAPGDVLVVNLWGEFEDRNEVRVTPDGKISLPTIGDLKIKGLTITQVDALVESKVKKYFRNVQSGVSLVGLRVFEVSILGSVRSPGTYLATPVRRVSDLISEAGGIQQGGSWRDIQVRRDGRIAARADLTDYLRRGNESSNPYVKDGDILFIPPMGGMVIVLITNDVNVSTQTGLVTENSTPNNIEIKEGERISHLMAETAGISPWWNLRDAYIMREVHNPDGRMKIPVDLQRILFEKDQSLDVELFNRDQLFIPSNVRRVFVNGVVRTGGAFAYVPNRTAEEYVGLAGGVMLQASLERSTIRRADGAVEPFRSDAILLEGDAIQIEQKFFATPADYVGVIGGITSLVFSGFAFLTTVK